jgi:hypothetical protein
MMRIARNELRKILSALPDVVEYGPRRECEEEAEALFICTLGFEPRALAVPRQLRDSGYKVSRAILLQYSTNSDDNAANSAEMFGCLRHITERVETLQVDDPDFTKRLKNILQSTVRGHRHSDLPCVTFDISAASNQAILRAMKALLDADVHLRILYAEATTYHPTKEEYECEFEKWSDESSLGLARGVSEVIPSTDYPGQHFDPRPDCVVLFPTFKAERSRAVISRIDPSLLMAPGDKVLWLLGTPHLQEDGWRTEAMRRINKIPNSAPQFEVSTFDFKKTLEALEQIYLERWEKFNITISPLGSKMQALGISLFCYLHWDVRVMFARPMEYNAALYSEGYRSIWEADITSVSLMRSQLDTVGKLVVAEAGVA